MNTMKRRNIFLILALFSLLFAGCKYDFILPAKVTPVDNGGNPISFSLQVVPIFADKCISCHKTQSPVMNVDVAYSQIVPNYINTVSPESSVLYVNASSGTHYAKVSAAQAGLILTWIKEGAQKN